MLSLKAVRIIKLLKAVFNENRFIVNLIYQVYIKQETLGVVTVAMISSTLASFRKFQYFQRPIYNPVEHL